MNETIIATINETVQKAPTLISTIDPNWLYSSIAQSSAAIKEEKEMTIPMVEKKSSLTKKGYRNQGRG